MKLISDTCTGSPINSNATETENTFPTETVTVCREREKEMFIIYEAEMIADGIRSN